MISLYWYFMYHKCCFVYLCYDFPIIGILSITIFVLYIFVMISLLLVFYVSQELFCISVLCFPYNWYFMLSQALFCISVFCFPYYWYFMLSFRFVFFVNWYFMFYKRCISVFCFPYYWYFMYDKCCFVSLCYDFPIIDILCLQELFCIFVFCFPYYWYFMYHKCYFVYLNYEFPIINILCFKSIVLYICVMISL